MYIKSQFVNKQGMLWCQGHTHAHPPAPLQNEWELLCAELPELGTQRRLHKSNPKLPDKCSLGCVPAHWCDITWQVELGSSAGYYLCPPPAASELLSFPLSQAREKSSCLIEVSCARGRISEGVSYPNEINLLG